MITKFGRKLWVFGIMAACAAPSNATADAPAAKAAPAAAAAPAPKAPAASPDHEITRTHEAMGTIIVLKAWSDDEEKVIQDFADAFAEFDRIDMLMTTWRDDSDISRINAAAGSGKGVKVSPEVIEVVQAAIAASRQTDGAFDVTVGVFQGTWKFDEDKDGSLPDDKLVQEKKKLVDWHDVIVDPRAQTVRLRRKGQKITLGGIAKGYSVDKVTKMLQKDGLVDFIVQAGGDMYVSGQKGNRKWKVGIRDPRGGRDDFFAFAEVQDATFSTSGDYERYVVKDGKRYHHILDPHTGYPADMCRSVTVMAPTAIMAEGLTKGIFILGWEKGIALVEKLGVDAVVVDAQNQVHVSKGLKDKLTIVHKPTDGV
jgi:thiamine biosynthesis lipoprotein